MNASLILKPKLNCLYTQRFYSLFNESFQFADNNFVFIPPLYCTYGMAYNMLAKGHPNDLLLHNVVQSRIEFRVFVCDAERIHAPFSNIPHIYAGLM